jgi:D-alanine-D-alanine ligase-like ATP-grasp enzyme
VVSSPTSFDAVINNALSTLAHLSPKRHAFRHEGKRKRSLDTSLLNDAALRTGLSRWRLSDDVLLIGDGDKRIGFVQNMPWTLSALDRLVTNNKELTKLVLDHAGLPTARGGMATSVDAARRIFRDIGAPVVVKPIGGAGGRGVIVEIRDEKDVITAAESVLAQADGLIVEECITSIDLRVMVVARQSIAVILRVPANVTGDGSSTLSELIARKNRSRRRNPYLANAPIRVTDDVSVRLARRGLGPDSVLPAGERLILHYKANLSAGGDSFNVTTLVHPDILRLAERAAGCFHSVNHAGIDVLVEDFVRPLNEQRGVICEINCNNDMPMHRFPLFGDPIDIARTELADYVDVAPTTPSRVKRVLSLVSPLRRLATVRPRRGRTPTPAAGRTRDRAPERDESPTRWSGLVGALAKPADPLPDVAATSLRDLDDRSLAAALGRHSWTNIHIDKRVVHATHGNQRVVVERHRSSAFAWEMRKRRLAWGRLLATEGVASCAAVRLRNDRYAEALDLIRAAGPWGIRPGDLRSRNTSPLALVTEHTLEEVWRRESAEHDWLIVEQAPQGLALRVLLLEGRPLCSIMLMAASVVGDGASTVGDLMDARDSARLRHPSLRHLTPSPTATDAVPDRSAVPAAGEHVLLRQTPDLSDGADSIGLDRDLSDGIRDTTAAVHGLLGTPGVFAVTFAARPADDIVRYPYWSVYAVDADPLLAPFAWPYAGHVPGSDVYDAVGHLLRSAPGYRLPDRAASPPAVT